MKSLNDIITVRSTMLATVFLLVLLAALITMGLLTPFIVRVSTGKEILLDAAYFNMRAALPVLFLVLLMITCLLIGAAGKKGAFAVLGLGIAGSLLSLFFSPFSSFSVNISFPLLAAALFSVVYRLFSFRGKRERTLKGTLRKISPHIVHLGAVLLLIGIVFSSNMSLEDSAVLSPGEEVTFPSMGYTVHVTNITSGFEGAPFGGYSGSAYASTINFDIYRGEKFFDSGQIKYITDIKWKQSYSETFIHRGLLEELFIAPKYVDLKARKVDLYIRSVPFMTSLWGGFFVMVFGILLLFISEFLSRENSFSENKCAHSLSSEKAPLENEKENNELMGKGM